MSLTVEQEFFITNLAVSNGRRGTKFGMGHY